MIVDTDSFDTPTLNGTSFAHGMMAATASYLDAIATGNTVQGRALLALAESFADGAVKATERDYPVEYDVAVALHNAIRSVVLV